MNWIDSHKRIDEGVTVGNCKMNRLLFAHELVLHAWIFSAGSSARILSVFCCVRLRRKENRHWKDCGIAGFLRRFRDPSRVPKIENRVPRIRENRVSTSQTNRVPTGPYRVPNIFLKKNLGYTLRSNNEHWNNYITKTNYVWGVKYRAVHFDFRWQQIPRTVDPCVDTAQAASFGALLEATGHIGLKPALLIWRKPYVFNI